MLFLGGSAISDVVLTGGYTGATEYLEHLVRRRYTATGLCRRHRRTPGRLARLSVVPTIRYQLLGSCAFLSR